MLRRATRFDVSLLALPDELLIPLLQLRANPLQHTRREIETMILDQCVDLPSRSCGVDEPATMAQKQKANGADGHHAKLSRPHPGAAVVQGDQIRGCLSSQHDCFKLTSVQRADRPAYIGLAQLGELGPANEVRQPQASLLYNDGRGQDLHETSFEQCQAVDLREEDQGARVSHQLHGRGAIWLTRFRSSVTHSSSIMNPWPKCSFKR